MASSTCSNSNTFASKNGALIILLSILNRPIDLDSIPVQVGTGRTMNVVRVTQKGEMEMEEETEEEELERARILREIMG